MPPPAATEPAGTPPRSGRTAAVPQHCQDDRQDASCRRDASTSSRRTSATASPEPPPPPRAHIDQRKDRRNRAALRGAVTAVAPELEEALGGLVPRRLAPAAAVVGL